MKLVDYSTMPAQILFAHNVLRNLWQAQYAHAHGVNVPATKHEVAPDEWCADILGMTRGQIITAMENKAEKEGYILSKFFRDFDSVMGLGGRGRHLSELAKWCGHVSETDGDAVGIVVNAGFFIGQHNLNDFLKGLLIEFNKRGDLELLEKEFQKFKGDMSKTMLSAQQNVVYAVLHRLEDSDLLMEVASFKNEAALRTFKLLRQELDELAITVRRLASPEREEDDDRPFY